MDYSSAAEAALCPQAQRIACQMKVEHINMSWLNSLAQDRAKYRADLERRLKVIAALEAELEAMLDPPWYKRSEFYGVLGFAAGVATTVGIVYLVKTDLR